MIRKFNLLLMAVMSALLLTACEDDVKDRKIDFVGDSIIACWDVAEYFPSRHVENFGKSGAGIDYIESLAGRFAGVDVVVMIGTNNGNLMMAADREDYARRYVAAIKGLDAKRVFLYSVLPRDLAADRSDINADILEFNRLVESAVATDASIVYVNLYSDFLRDNEPNPQLYNDGLHLSPYGYEILAHSLKKLL